jgi:hypothetical protein
VSTELKSAVRWAGKNLALVLGLTLIGSTLGAIYEAGEVPAVAYTTIEQNWSRLTPATQHTIAETMREHGRLRKWDYYPKIFDALLNDTGGYAVPQTDDDAQSARERLAHLTQLAGTDSSEHAPPR